MPKPDQASVLITIEPLKGAYDPDFGSVEVMRPYDIADTVDVKGRVKVTRPSGPGTAEGGGGDYVQGRIEVTKGSLLEMSFRVQDKAQPAATYLVCGVVFNSEAMAQLKAAFNEGR